jgi:hypothetical protein
VFGGVQALADDGVRLNTLCKMGQGIARKYAQAQSSAA